MTPEEYYALVKKVAEDIGKAIKEAYELLLRLIRGGASYKDAIEEATSQAGDRFKTIFAAAITQITGEAVEAATYMAGELTLSSRLYSESLRTSSAVQGVINNHTRGFQDARALALELYEGYGFNESELLNLSPDNPRLPKYLREALLPDNSVRREMARAYAKAQARALKTGALRAAYTELLGAIDKIEDGVGSDYLDKKLQVAFEERMRYFSNRIAQTELHRAFAIQQAKELLADDAVKYVQWRLNPRHPIEDICDYFAGIDKYGLGRGVYPKALAPVAPAHPFCKCVLSPRLDLNNLEPKEREDAEQRFFSSLSQDNQRKVAGSRKKLNRIRAGESAWDVHNSKIDPVYQVKPAGSL